jgi:hypothetical protein
MTNGNVRILDCSIFLLRYNVYTSLGRLVTSVWKNGTCVIEYLSEILRHSLCMMANPKYKRLNGFKD